MLQKNRFTHQLFLTSIIIKGVDGILELSGGVILFFVKSDHIAAFIQGLFHHELMQDPHDIIANYLVHASQNIATGTLFFASLYLLLHGMIKISISIGLLRRKIWMYPIASVILIFFVSYQIIRIIHFHSIILFFLTLFDVMIIFLIRKEYQMAQQKPYSSSCST
jgi:uncharacterized membrane protein